MRTPTLLLIIVQVETFDMVVGVFRSIPYEDVTSISPCTYQKLKKD